MAQFNTDQETLSKNRAKIKKISFFLKIATISIIIAGVSIAGFIFFHEDIFAYLLIAGLLVAGLASDACASATGHAALSLTDLGRATSADGDVIGSVLLLPIMFLANIYYILVGWVYGLKEKSSLLEENKQIIARCKNKKQY